MCSASFIVSSVCATSWQLGRLDIPGNHHRLSVRGTPTGNYVHNRVRSLLFTLGFVTPHHTPTPPLFTLTHFTLIFSHITLHTRIPTYHSHTSLESPYLSHPLLESTSLRHQTHPHILTRLSSSPHSSTRPFPPSPIAPLTQLTLTL